MGQSFSLAPADINGDNAIDLVVSYFDDGIVGWYRNLGSGNFASMQLINSGPIGVNNGVVAADLDGDSDNDIVLGIGNGSGLYWYENTDGNGSSWEEHIIDLGIAEARIQDVGDIDGDGDIDILTNGSNGGTRISWYENTDGMGTFGNQTAIDVTGAYEIAVYLVDMDGDDDLDTVSSKGDLVVWRENLDGLGNFGPTQIISSEVLLTYDVFYGDINHDSFIDVLSASTNDNKVAWYKSIDGMGSFEPQEIIDPNLPKPRTITAADLDGDTDLDVLSASLIVGVYELVWYENLTILNTQDISLPNIKVYPNPANEVLNIECTITIERVTIYNIWGMRLKETITGFNEISLAGLPSGLLFVEVETNIGKTVQKIIKK